MADKLGLGTGVHDLKIGQSFFNAAAGGPAGRGRGGPGPGGRGRQGAPQGAQALPSYHTIRYDFKPASSSTSSSGFLSVDPETQGVKVTVPHENGDSQTNFRYIHNPGVGKRKRVQPKSENANVKSFEMSPDMI